ncbi:SusC/RagA family TonB-linked outer membrane protein [Dokdonia sinensis]|uniref:SusC/RagA family TonB-linked outer membrane protein n=1 Tax=Dokdonia sinensis TaxID=2479847 RepID=A0A3M0G0R5_9FLAO|nr:SusC/RagA family TonB-linked outer membrane protein [Dokdonia sinensis]RMB58561.1 SusC/RagA family TonB-linked outer membrane protein [Dokdonia sinensis]
MKKVLLKSMLLLVATLFAGISYAQTVTGTVTEENGPLPGANVVVKGTSNGATTDFDGNYTLNEVPSDAVLVFSYVGYASQEVAVAGRSVVNVAMASDNALDEVILIGYGSTTIKDATGSVTAVTSEDFNQGVISSPEQLIAGKSAGVQITETSGSPGAGINIRIRGASSVRGGNDPLFVVDGIPLSGGGAPAPGGLGVGGGDARNPLSFLNPNDIENISILKDASATAIYGARAANGVVIIQTKKGKGRKGVFELNTSVSSAFARKKYDLLDRENFLDAIEKFGGDREAADFGFDNDFQDEVLRNAFSRRTDLAYSKGFETGNVRIGGSYSNQFGIIENSGQERITGRLNATKRFFDDKLTIDFTGAISRVNDQAPPLAATAGFNGDLLGSAIIANPTWPVDSTFNPQGGARNPLNLLDNYDARSNSERYLANIAGTFDITEELSARAAFGYDENDTQTTAIYTSDVFGFQGISGDGRGQIARFKEINKLLEGTLNYKKEFGNVNLDLLAGYSYQQFNRQGFNGEGWGFQNSNLNNMRDALFNAYDELERAAGSSAQIYGYDGNIAVSQTLNTETEQVEQTDITNSFDRPVRSFFADEFSNADEIQSFFFRANASILDKYLITATVRRDGSSVFGPNEKYGNFPSGAIAWKISEEDFVGENVSTLKLRIGAGVVGNSQGLGFARFLQLNTIGGPSINNDGDLLLGALTSQGAFNPNLKWENTVDYNLGLDFGFNNDRLNGTFNVYRKETNDLLFETQSAFPGSGPRVFQNLSQFTVINQGVEFAINYDFVQTEDVTFSANFNIAYNDNVVEGAPGDINTGEIRGQGLTGAFSQRLSSGQPLFSWFMPVFEGFDDDGFPIYEDVDGDGLGDAALDKKFVGENALPDVTGGLSLNLRYKRWNVGTYFVGQFGFSVYNATANAFFTAGNPTSGRNTNFDVLNSPESGGSSADVSTRFLEKGDFVRLQNATVGYDWPLSGDGFIDSLRLSATAQNLFLITGYSGLDPEITSNTGDLGSGVPTQGIDYSSFPRPTTITLGVNARF